MLSISDTICQVFQPFLKGYPTDLSRSLTEKTIDQLALQYFPGTDLTEAKVSAIETLNEKLTGRLESSSSSDKELIDKINRLARMLRTALTAQARQTLISSETVATEGKALQTLTFPTATYGILPFELLGEIIRHLPLKGLTTFSQLNRRSRASVIDFLERAACQIVKEFEIDERADPFLRCLQTFRRGLSSKNHKSIAIRAEEAYATFGQGLSFFEKGTPGITAQELSHSFSRSIQLTAACHMSFEAYFTQLAELKAHRLFLKNLPEPFKNDFWTVLIAVTNQPHALEHASVNLKNNPIVAIAAVTQDGNALCFASPEMRNNPIVATAAVTQDGNALLFAGLDLQNNLTVVTAAVTQTGMALYYASETLQQNATLRALAGLRPLV